MRMQSLAVGSVFLACAAAAGAEAGGAARHPEAGGGLRAAARPPAGAASATSSAAAQGPTRGNEMMPPFDPRYFLGEWEIEWNPPETGLFPPGRWSGTETVTHIANRYLRISIAMENEDGVTMTGDGILFYEFGLGGQTITRFVRYDAGFSIFQYGPLGGDLGGYYSTFWETPEIAYDDRTFVLKGRSYFVSPAAYRINQQVSIDGAAFFNFGIMWLTKAVDEAPGQR